MSHHVGCVLDGVACLFTTPRETNQSQAEITWRPPVEPRPVTIAARMRWDGLLTGATVNENVGGVGPVALDGHRQPVETEMWDTQTGTLIGATTPTSTIKRIELRTHVISHEPRLFSCPDADGALGPARVMLLASSLTKVGEPATQDANFWRGRRQDLEEKQRLDQTRDFVQYRPAPGSLDERVRALDDLRFLINTHGSQGVDLWDPYLCAEDILQTLFWCQHAGAPLRALTDGRDPPQPARSCGLPVAASQRPSFADRQKIVLTQNSGNRERLQLEYRIRSGPKGWAFHDRFLIFPNGEAGPQAWAIGASINSAGKAHHILQRVSNPSLIAGAFQDLWSALDEAKHVVWKSP
ncbi:VPA1262 family N-terminal domain-containing protein [Mesorhizobium captivum]|uniref:VPA1262 family N-terminal domain-containing protein n=1 Tax=Mesorhizobium captivum TaxID=3072319 RepID=UPI003D31EA4F